jgi:hypothetical protein
MKEIHFIQSSPKLRPWREEEGGDYKSGYWHVSESQATSAIGAKIFFHEKQASPSFLAGIITGFEVQKTGQWEGRIIFSFSRSVDLEGLKTDPDGWFREKKIVE